MLESRGSAWEPAGERQLSEVVLPVAGMDNPVAGPHPWTLLGRAMIVSVMGAGAA